MINNLTVTAKSVTWFTTQQISQTGITTALRCGFFMSAHLYLPAMTGWSWFRLRSERLCSVCVPLCGEAKIQPVTLLKSPLQFCDSMKNKRSTTMAHLRLDSDCLSVYGKRVRNAIQFNLPKFGDSPRILLDPNEISTLSKISVDNVIRGVRELEREGYIARMFKGRRSKAHVFALLNPELKGSVVEVWA
jgi:hypothetical protein